MILERISGSSFRACYVSPSCSIPSGSPVFLFISARGVTRVIVVGGFQPPSIGKALFQIMNIQRLEDK